MHNQTILGNIVSDKLTNDTQKIRYKIFLTNWPKLIAVKILILVYWGKSNQRARSQEALKRGIVMRRVVCSIIRDVAWVLSGNPRARIARNLKEGVLHRSQWVSARSSEMRKRARASMNSGRIREYSRRPEAGNGPARQCSVAFSYSDTSCCDMHY